MSSENQENQEQKQDEKKELKISAKKYSTLVDFEEDFYRENDLMKKKSEEDSKKQEEELNKKDEEKQKLLDHWAKLLLKEPPRRRTCHTSFIYNSVFYVIGGIDITEQKQDDIYKVDLKEPNPCWQKVDILGEKMGRIAYHAGAELNGFYYIIGGQDENLNILNSIQIFDLTQENMSEKYNNIELESNLQITDPQKLELLKKVFQILRAKIKDKIESDKINVLETDLEKELLKYIDEDNLISREKLLVSEIEDDLKTEDINKLTDSSIDLEKINTEDLDKTFRPELISESINKINEKIKIYFPPLESHTVNVNDEKTLLIIYGGMSKKEYNRHVLTFDPQTKTAKNLTENLDVDKMPPPRQDHAAVIYNGSLYVYGGIGPDSKIYDDMWKFDLSSNTWEEIKTDAQRNKEERRKKRIEEKIANNEEIETEDEEDFDDEEDENNKDIRPKGRSGHSMVLVGDLFYIFGGKTGLIKESNEIWEFNPNERIYECVHETLLEQFTKEELQKISSENKRNVQKFRWLTRSDIEKRTNPSFNDNLNNEKKIKDKNKKNDKSSPDKKSNKKTDKNKKTKTTKKSDKTDNKNGQNKDIEGKYSAQVLCRPNVLKMRKTLIFTSDPEKIKKGLNTLSQDEKEKINSEIQQIKGELPEPRDGQSVCVEGTNIYIFGGDRFKFPFNDLFVFDTVSLPKMGVQESRIQKIIKEKEREEKKIREQKKKEEQEEEEKMKAKQEERKKFEEKINEEDENGEKKDEEGKEKDKENDEDGKEKDEKTKKDEQKEEDIKEEDLKLLRNILQY